MKTFWKVLGAAALAIGFTPYRIEKNDETGERKFQALLWQATTTPREGDWDALDINLGLKLPGAAEEEPHLFSDELCVEYTGAPVSEPPAPPVEKEAPAEPPVEEAAVEEAPAEASEAPAAPEEKTKEEA